MQYSKIATLKKDSKDYQFLSENISRTYVKKSMDIIKKNNQMFKSIGIQFVQSDLSNKTKSRMLKNPTKNIEELQRTCRPDVKRSIRKSNQSQLEE